MKSKKCIVIKGSSVQVAEVIENPITVIASHLFLQMWFSVKGEPAFSVELLNGPASKRQWNETLCNQRGNLP